MAQHILIAYASKYGATKEIAERISNVLHKAGLHVDVLPADKVRAVDIYHAIILGSAVYAGQWRGEAVSFLLKYEDEMSIRPTWFFSSGPTGEEDPLEIMKGWRFPVAQQVIANRINPRDIAFFHGFLNPERLSFAERIIIRGIGAKTGDFRDWDDIENWATSIAEQLHAEPVEF